MPYAVLTDTIGGWEDCWTEEGADSGERPMRFETELEAALELRDHLNTCRRAGMDYSRSDYKIVEVTDEPENAMPDF